MRLHYDRECGYWQLDITERAFAHAINEWRQLRGGYNWYTFHPIQIEVERDDIAPGYEATIIVLGLGFRIRINKDWTGTALQETLDAIECGDEELLDLDDLLTLD